MLLGWFILDRFVQFLVDFLGRKTKRRRLTSNQLIKRLI
jgi:hypothetical protein